MKGETVGLHRFASVENLRVLAHSRLERRPPKSIRDLAVLAARQLPYRSKELTLLHHWQDAD